MMNTTYFSLGTNLGNRLKNITELKIKQRTDLCLSAK